MKIAVLSGKGGTGKTFVSVNLAVAAQNATYIDCDVEEPNGRLFLKPNNCISKDVYTSLPKFDIEKCNGCRKCVEFCNFNALVFVKDKPMLFKEVCHACGGCKIICPQQAILETQRQVGVVEIGQYKNVDVITGILNEGEVSGVGVIKEALACGTEKAKSVIIDCPPGSGCSVMESVMACDCAVLVAEPTAFGFHNFKMVYNLVTLLKKPCYVVINKADGPYMPLEDFCTENKAKILMRVPYNNELAKLCAQGKLAYENDNECKVLFDCLLNSVNQEVSV